MAHNQHDVRELKRRTHANRLNGIDCEWLNTDQVKEFCPIINCSPNIRYQVMGSTLQKRAGTARHDAVAWGYARGADSMGVDIIQNCECAPPRVGSQRPEPSVDSAIRFRTGRRVRSARSSSKNSPWRAALAHSFPTTNTSSRRNASRGTPPSGETEVVYSSSRWTELRSSTATFLTWSTFSRRATFSS